MLKRLIKWRLQIWIACFAILMNALAPSISHALAAAGAMPAVVEICTVEGRVAAVLDDAAPLSGMSAMADCAYCLPHGGSDLLTPPAPTALGLSGGHALRPFLFYRAPTPLLVLSAAPPRGPPAAA